MNVEQTASVAVSARRTSILTAVALIALLTVALALRLRGFDWDQGQNVHPDERFVAGSLAHNVTFPQSPFDLFDRDSGWNPAVAAALGGATVSGHPPHDPAGFNYGSLPIYLIYLFAHLLSSLGGWMPGWSNWKAATGDPIHAGRVLSAIADTVTVYLVYAIGARLSGRLTGLYAAALAAFAVLSIQLAHFATVDTLLTTLSTGTLLACIDLLTAGRPRNYAIVGLWLAAALATKASAVPLVAVVVLAHLWRRRRAGGILDMRTISELVPLLATCLPALFLFQPYMFVDWSDFSRGIRGQSDLASGSTIVFYTIKWHGTTPIVYPFTQLSLYSLGLPLAILAYAGAAYVGLRTLTRARNAGALVAFFTVSYFVSAGILYMKYLRYMEPIVPSLCLLAALLTAGLVRNRIWLIRRFVRAIGLAIGAAVLTLTALYGLSYQHIYSQPLTRVQASCWLFTHVPAGTPIAQDSFDEGMPVGSCGLIAPPTYPQAAGIGMPTYDPESVAKVQTMATILSRARYYVSQSRRASETFTNDAEEYPYTHRFYTILLGSPEGRQDALGYTLVARFVEHPQLGPWTFTEQGANQNFNEYDHPPVYIFRNTGHLGAGAIVTALAGSGGFASSASIVTPTRSLMLPAKDIAANQRGASYGAMFPADSLPMRLPVPVWLLMVEALGLLALPISLRLFGRLADGGFVLAKTVGILLVSYLAWILPSLHLADYSRGEIALCLLPIAALSLAWGVPPRDAAAAIRARRVPVLLTEAVFLAGFLGFVWIRMLYPDMWHLISGGEKTMDFSFLNAIVRSRAMPPYDPWFSGGYLNYYYYGHFTVATLLKLAGIAPVTAINLAVPTFFALALATCVSIGYNIARRIGWALLAGAMALLSGNLYGAQHLVGDLQAASPVRDSLGPVTSVHSGVFLIGGIIDLVSVCWSLLSGVLRGTIAVVLGIWQVGTGHAGLPHYFFSFDWPWDESRIIDNHTVITEFPFWTFLFADPHAHMWDIPFALCILALAFNFASRDNGEAPYGQEAAGSLERVPALLPGGSLAVWGVIGVVIGAVGPTNPWDLAAMLGAVGLAIGANGLWRGIGWWRTIYATVWRLALIVVLVFGLYAPFYSHFQSFYSSIGWTILRHQTPIADFLTHFGFQILILASYLLFATLRETNIGLWARARARALLFTLYYWDRREELRRLFEAARHMERAGRRAPTFRSLAFPVRATAIAAAVLVLGFLAIGYLVLALLISLISLAVLSLIDRRERQDVNLLFLHLLIALGLSVAAAGEIVYVRDFYDSSDPANTTFRNNTIFKIYEQAWLMMGIGSAIALLRQLGSLLPELVPTPAWLRMVNGHVARERGRLTARPSGWAWAWIGAVALLLLGAAITPVRLVPIRVGERQTWTVLQYARIDPTLDGSAFLRRAYPGEYAAIAWINGHIAGSPVMLQSRWGNYRDFAARVTMFTGLPTVVDWGFEDAQQRYSGQQITPIRIYPSEIAPREQDVDLIYDTTDTTLALALLHRYGVSYVYVGAFERHGFADDPDTDPGNPGRFGYAPLGLAKFPLMAAAGQLRLVYDLAGVQIYRVAH